MTTHLHRSGDHATTDCSPERCGSMPTRPFDVFHPAWNGLMDRIAEEVRYDVPRLDTSDVHEIVAAMIRMGFTIEPPAEGAGS